MPRLAQLALVAVVAASSAACLQARASAVAPDDGVIRWTVLRYEGELGVEKIDRLLAASVPHNGGVVSQIDFVLEHSQGWQRTGVDFQQTADPNETDILVFISPNHDVVSCGAHGMAAGCAGPTEYQGRVVCQVTAANDWRDTIVVNHEVGHCLGLAHSDGPGVMTIDFNKMRSWPTDDEIDRAGRNLR
jgi:Metallo-peptidase family M12B Reprolysin-like